MKTAVMLANGEVTREDLRFDPFFKDILPHLEGDTLKKMAADLYSKMEMGGHPDWNAIGAFNAVKDVLSDRGVTVKTVQSAPGRWVLILSTLHAEGEG
jgi:hypothetical protein